MQLSPHFTLAEFTVTQQPHDNTLPVELVPMAIYTAGKMETVRKLLRNFPVTVTSAYRSPKVNKAVGGSATSEHPMMRAVDFVCPKFGTPNSICKSLVQHADELNYNQLIEEGTWVHISFPPVGKIGKKEVLTMRNGKYKKGLI